MFSGGQWTGWPFRSIRADGKQTKHDKIVVCVINTCIILVFMCVSQGAPGFTGQVGAQGANGSRVRLPLQVFIIIQ